jgi:hypothetical protein
LTWEAIAFVDELYHSTEQDRIFLFKVDLALLAFNERIISKSRSEKWYVGKFILVNVE